MIRSQLNLMFSNINIRTPLCTCFFSSHWVSAPTPHSRAILSIGEVSHCLSPGITGLAQSTSADIMFKHIKLQLYAESSRGVVLKSLRAKAVQKIILTKPFNKPLTLYSTHRSNQMARRSQWWEGQHSHFNGVCH